MREKHFRVFFYVACAWLIAVIAYAICMTIGCTSASSLAGFSEPQFVLTRKPDGTWNVKASSDFSGTGRIEQHAPDGTAVIVDIKADSDVSSPTLAQGERYATSGVAEVQREQILANKEAFSGIMNLFGTALQSLPGIMAASQPPAPQPSPVVPVP